MREFVVRDSALLEAPIGRCFLLSTSIDLVQRTLGMRPSAKESKKAAGMIEAGDQLVWRGWKFGLPAMHETLITAYDRPNHFQDTMGRGRFARFQHDHWFEAGPGAAGNEATELRDEVRFALPLGWAGAMVGRWIMAPYVRALVRRRFALLKQVAEGEEWRRYLPELSTQTPGAA